jgi:uncharacterized Zn finger protein (UPF0148 family)
MDQKTCTACKAPHFEAYDLCAYCSAERQAELEHRLRDDDGAIEFQVIAAWALFGPPKGIKR